MPTVAAISGAPAETSRVNGLIGYARRKLEENGVSVRTIQVTALPHSDLLLGKSDGAPIREAVDSTTLADGVIVASPVYKATYSGILKTFLDLLPPKGLSGKPVLPLFVGGTIAHLLAIDFGLKPVLSVLGARCLLQGVYAVDDQVAREGDGVFRIAEEVRARLDESVDELLRFLPAAVKSPAS
ncbi:MAG: FMN reductase (NADPH) [Candidatus Reconcilbacillus cellulovorans]|uniref:FMN reductase (NADPH) n=1 Tax=Candidatus Reconcilbacillus cellulovorans TaxID=1906605 RepID=A0A2A6E1A1_9BACL|nr:MAG: FMN reductase (NADPH) [Candidatus Reconcilbacillus cellulovorans]